MNKDLYKDIKLVIFDCDGVLIDSESISTEVLSSQFLEIGLDISVDYVKKHFIGHSYKNVQEHLKNKFDVILEENFEKEYRSKLLLTFEKDLKACEGIHFVLKNLNINKCVATSSSLIRATKSLKLLGLYDFFEDNINSAYNMGDKGKPAPDIYLLAAKKFNIEPKDVLVIEDSLVGIQGAKRAGMKVWHYIGASHLKDWNKEHEYVFKPDEVFNDMNNFFLNIPHLKL